MTDLPQANNMQRSPLTKHQFYGIMNEPLPPIPNFRQSPPAMFTPQQQHQPTPSSSSLMPQQQQQHLVQHRSTIVGPSDHYGIHQSYNINNNNNGNSNGRKYDVNENNVPKSAKNHINSPFSSDQEETKVCVIVDTRTPVIFKIPLPPSRITLADLKLALPAINQPNYKYFFKSNDSEFGIVKEEIQDDDSRLPTYRDRVVAWIVTPGRIGDELAPKTKSETDTCNLTYSNTSYDDGSSSRMTTDIESTSYFTDDDSLSCSNYSETTCDTFISQRRNRHYKNGERSPTHHNDHQNNSPYRYNSHRRARDYDVSSSSSTTSSSATNSDATALHFLPVNLVLTKENFLGLHVYAKATNDAEEGIYVAGVTENSAVALDGRIKHGDKLIQVNDYNLEELSNEEAVRVLKDAVIKRGPLKLVVARSVETNEEDVRDGIVSPQEAIHPIDTAAWVAHAQAITILNNQETANSATSSPSFGSNAQDTDCIRPASTGIARINSGLRLSRGTTDTKEIIQQMKLPEVGLEIKDREWLKINIAKAFLGSNLVTWLRRNVYGFNNNREAKNFASRMLKEGYIRDPISKKSFSSKSYYQFVI